MLYPPPWKAIAGLIVAANGQIVGRFGTVDGASSCSADLAFVVAASVNLVAVSRVDRLRLRR